MIGTFLVKIWATRTQLDLLTDVFSYDTNDTEDICDYDGHEPIYKYGTKVCNQFKFCKNGEHAIGTCPEGQYFDTVVGESFIS